MINMIYMTYLALLRCIKKLDNLIMFDYYKRGNVSVRICPLQLL